MYKSNDPSVDMSRSIRILLVLFCFAQPAVAGGSLPWKELPSPTTKLLYKLSFLDASHGWIAGFNGTILRTTDAGTSWVAQAAGVSNDIREIFMLNDRLGWALAFEQFVDTSIWYGTRMLRTTDGGDQWTNKEYPQTGEFFNSIVFKDSLHGWMAGEFGHMVRTTDAGTTWFPVEVDSSQYALWKLIRVKFLTPQLGFAMGGRIEQAGVVWKSSDGGFQWSRDTVGPDPVYDIHMVDSLHLIGVVGGFDDGASMIRSRNGGATWEFRFLSIFGVPHTLAFRTSTEAWAPLGFAGAMIYTTDTAHTWTSLDTPRRKPIYDLVFLDSLTGYAVGDSGIILKYDPSLVAVDDRVPTTPPSFRLEQNFPNPFNPSTTIMYDLPATMHVSLKVFDVLGRHVATLVDQTQQAGHASVVWNAEGVGSGLFLYRLEARPVNGQSGAFNQTGKMLLLK